MFEKPPTWMRSVLGAAALYNILWGAWAVIFPNAGFELAGMKPPPFPELWQYIGMISGIFGAGYAIAAVNPIRHWPIVFIGLLGKILGPIGFIHAAASGHLPWVAGWTILTSDVIWWVPFGLILRATWQSHLGALRHSSPEVLSIALRARTLNGVSLEQMSETAPVLMVFLRHAGCMFCREALADLSRQKRKLEQANIQIVLIHMGEPEFGPIFFSNFRLQDLPQISDPRRTLYRAFGLRRGDLRIFVGPRVWWRGFRAAIIDGHGFGRLVDDIFQMPGVFLLFHGQILRCYRHQNIADRPDYVRFATADLREPVY